MLSDASTTGDFLEQCDKTWGYNQNEQSLLSPQCFHFFPSNYTFICRDFSCFSQYVVCGISVVCDIKSALTFSHIQQIYSRLLSKHFY